MFEPEQTWTASRRTALLALAVIGLSAAAQAAEKQRLTPQVLWSMKRLASPALSPDGTLGGFHGPGVVDREEQEHHEPLARGRGERDDVAA